VLLVRARDNLAEFRGRTKLFGGRIYISLEDYLSWPGRSIKQDPGIEEGLLASSLKSVAEAHLPPSQATKKRVKDRSSKPKTQSKDPLRAEIAASWAEELRKLTIDIRCAAALGRISAERNFRGENVLFQIIVDQIRSSADHIDFMIYSLDVLVEENLSVQIDLEEAAQSAQKEANRKLGLLIKLAKETALKNIEPELNFLRRFPKKKRSSQNRVEGFNSFPEFADFVLNDLKQRKNLPRDLEETQNKSGPVSDD
jgi:hypothetical protein